METFVHEFKSQINCYKALAVRRGMNAEPVSVYDGRMCYVANTIRTRRKKGWGFFNLYQVNFLDGTVAMIPSGEFNKKAKVAPLPADHD